MSLDRCLFAVRSHGGDGRDLVASRVDLLTKFYAPLGASGQSLLREPAPGIAIGVVDLGEGRPDADDVLTFGGALPPGLDSAAELRGAGDSTLRSLPGAVAAVAADTAGVCLITGPVAPTMLYEASAEGATAWSTHAVAASFLATGFARVDPSALPVFVASEYVGGDRSLIAGVRALPVATRVVATAGGVDKRSYWPADERWSSIEPETAQHEGEQALLATLGAALEATTLPVLGLTGGIDSRVAAVAMRELGLEFETMTFGEPDWPDVRAGERMAETLGVGHRFVALELWSDEEAVRRVSGEVRWNEGAIFVGFGRVPVPPPIGAWVTGAGAETGRAYYHRHVDGDREQAEFDELSATMLQALVRRVRGARPEAFELLGERVGAWLADARAAGATGWRALDLLYAEQRVMSWGRANLPREPAPMVFAFAHPRVQRALASLPVTDRRADAFHRRFLARFAPEVALNESRERSGVLRRALRRVGRSRGRRSVLADHWGDRPRFRSWVDDLLASPMLADQLGSVWVDRVRRGFERGDPELEELAMWAVAPIALDAQLAELNRKG